MKVLAINSSARVGGQSKTELVLNHLVQGMESEGAEVEIVNIYKKKINYCIGCFTCWTKTPGECIHRDDMSKELFPKYMAADLCVMATPLFHYTVNANLKTFIERTLPLLLPFFESSGGNTGHPLRQIPPPVVAVSVAGFPEYSVFDQLSSYMRFLYKTHLKAEIYVPGAEMLAGRTGSPKTKTVLAGIIQGGKELVTSGQISEKTMSCINTPTLDFETMAPAGNIFWKTCIAEGVTPKEFEKRGMVPRPDSLESFLSILKMGFNSEKAGDFKGAYQFIFTGEVAGDCYFDVKNGKAETGLGSVTQPDVTIKAPFEVWMDILTRKADGQQMFMDQKYQVEGDISLLVKMGDIMG